MVDIRTTYLGLELKSPLVSSATPLARDLDNIRKLEDAGASAIVLNSLYEEEIQQEREALMHYLDLGTDSYAEALSYFPEPDVYYAKTDDYLEHVRKCKEATNIPIIPSLNGASLGGWTSFAKLMQDAGADAIELNIYFIPTDPNQSGVEVENMYVDIVKAVKQSVTIPIAVKLSPYFSNMANMAKRLDEAGADSLVLFNRFYQPDIDLDTMEPDPNILLSTSYDMRLPMRWIGILYGHVEADLAATSGIHSVKDVVKMLMVGADVTMMTSVILKQGIKYFGKLEGGLLEWLETYEYESVAQLKGSMSQLHSPDPSAFERAQYMRGLRTYLFYHS